MPYGMRIFLRWQFFGFLRVNSLIPGFSTETLIPEAAEKAAEVRREIDLCFLNRSLIPNGIQIIPKGLEIRYRFACTHLQM